MEDQTDFKASEFQDYKSHDPDAYLLKNLNLNCGYHSEDGINAVTLTHLNSRSLDKNMD